MAMYAQEELPVPAMSFQQAQHLEISLLIHLLTRQTQQEYVEAESVRPSQLFHTSCFGQIRHRTSPSRFLAVCVRRRMLPVPTLPFLQSVGHQTAPFHLMAAE